MSYAGPMSSEGLWKSVSPGALVAGLATAAAAAALDTRAPLSVTDPRVGCAADSKRLSAAGTTNGTTALALTGGVYPQPGAAGKGIALLDLTTRTFNFVGTIVSADGVGGVVLSGTATAASGLDVEFGTDDRAALNAGLALVGQAGGGTLRIPANKRLYLGGSDDYTGGLLAGLLFKYDNVTLDGHGDSSVLFFANSSGNLRPIMVLGPAKSNAASSWASNIGPAKAVKAISAAAKYDVQVTLTTPADASNWAPGAIAMVKTGQTITGSASSQPDSELVMVRTINAGTGVVTIDQALACAYVQEYYVSGSTGATTPTGASGNAAPFGLAIVDDSILRHIRLTNFRIEVYAASPCQTISLWGVWRAEVSRITGAWGSAFCGGREFRHVHIHGCDGVMPTAAATSVWIDPSTGCADTLIEYNKVDSKGNVCFHNNEGPKHITWRGNVAHARDCTSNALVSISGRGYNIVVDGNVITGVGNGSTFFATIDNSGYLGSGVIKRNIFDVSGGGTIRNDAGAGFIIDENYPPGLTTSLRGFANYPNSQGHHVGLNIYQIVVDYTLVSGSDTAIGFTLPQYGVVKEVVIEVMTVFNATSSNVLSVGYSGASGQYEANQTLVATGAFVTAHGKQEITQARAVTAKYTQTGTAATAGKARITLYWYIGARVS